MYTLVAKSEDEEIPKSVLFGKTSTEADLQRQGIVYFDRPKDRTQFMLFI